LFGKYRCRAPPAPLRPGRRRIRLDVTELAGLRCRLAVTVDGDRYERSGAGRWEGGGLSGARYVPGPRSAHDTTVLRAIEATVAVIGD